MVITCWGSRGSIPVSGTDYIKYGGDTTCIEIRTKSNDIIIIDAGTGIRRLGNRLMDKIVQDCQYRISEKGNKLECFAVACDMMFNL